MHASKSVGRGYVAYGVDSVIMGDRVLCPIVMSIY
jgi:hypothetical protein